jgi:hypothetical protein
MSWSIPTTLAFTAVLFLAGPATGQEMASTGGTPGAVTSEAAAPLLAGPTASTASLFPAPQVLDTQLGAALPVAAQRARTNSPALMLIGGATMVVGALVGGDAGTIIMIGGGAVALVGLWRYMQ